MAFNQIRANGKHAAKILELRREAATATNDGARLDDDLASDGADEPDDDEGDDAA